MSRCLVCCFGCLTVCGCKNAVGRRLVFFPPKPFYTVEERKTADGRFQQIMWIVDEEGKKGAPYASQNFTIDWIPTKHGTKICTVFIRYPRSKWTILFSHGNATDLGCMRDHLIDMAVRLKVNVACYDYTGYGLSEGRPTVKNVYNDVEAVHQHICCKFGVRTEDIILYGQSLGTGPALYTACKYPSVRGVILHAGLMSGLRVIRQQSRTLWFDIFPNIDRVAHVKCPVFVIHGTQDKDIPVHHGMAMADAAFNRYEPWFVEGGDHNNIEIHWREPYFEKLRDFVTYVTRQEPAQM